MKTTVEFLDTVRAKHGLTSDYQLAKHLSCTPSSIGNYRHGKSKLDDAMACKVAADLGLDSSYVLACIASERAKKPEVKAAWKHAAEVLYGIAAVLALVAILPSATLPSWDGFNAALHGLSAFDNSHYYASGIYIMRIAAGYWWALLPLVVLAFIYRPRKGQCRPHH